MIDLGRWEENRSRLHHDDFHHRFYQYFGGAGSDAEDIAVKGISRVLSGESTELPLGSAKAFNHWPEISNNLHDLLSRAPAEVVADDTAVLAMLALRAVEENSYPTDLAKKVRDEANTILARSAEVNRERITAAIAEPMRLLKSIDDFIMLVQRRGNSLPCTEAEAQVREFLDECQQLDRALSAIPIRLREGAPDGR